MAPLAGRRLAELLQEQQEPFLLDVYLLENGYSGRSVCTEATATCWPAGTACRRLQRLGCSCHGFQSRREGILGCLVGVFGRRRPPKAPNGRRGALEDGGSPSSSRMARKARSTCREDAGDLGKIKVGKLCRRFVSSFMIELELASDGLCSCRLTQREPMGGSPRRRPSSSAPCLSWSCSTLTMVRRHMTTVPSLSLSLSP